MIPEFKLAYEQYEEAGISFPEPTRTQQQFADEVNINSIMERYERTGVMPVGDMKPAFGDFSNVLSFQDAQNRIANINEMFMELNANIRDQFDNDPGKMIEFLNNIDNRQAAIDMGLIDKPANVPSGKPIDVGPIPVPPVVKPVEKAQ